jgi:hypothetical protein
MDLPEFVEDGVLPPGDYQLTVGELRESMLVRGPGAGAGLHRQTWDESWRRKLVDNLEVLVTQLRQVGIAEVYIDGSFAEDKDHPNDIDGYFVCDLKRFATGDLERELNLLDPHKVWTWDPRFRRPYLGYDKLQLPMWHKYRVELYPHFGQISGIHDRFGNELDFPSAFRISRRSDTPKGIIRIGGLS